MQSLRGLASNFFEILILKKGLDAMEGKKNQCFETDLWSRNRSEPNSLVPLYLIKGMN